MITIVAEKYDVAGKLAAALDKIVLKSGKVVSFKELKANEDAVHRQLKADGYVKIHFNGQECYVTFGYGHLCELKQAKDYNPVYANWRNIPLPFLPPVYEIQLRQMSKAKDKYGYNKKIENQFHIIKNLINKSDYVINATDDDREGELIFAYIYQLAGCTKPVKRACLDSQTEKGIQQAFSKLKDSSAMKNREMAGRTRSIADWVIGSNLTAAATIKYSASDILSIGRVQTPTLKIVVDKELQIREFKKEKYWNISAVFTTVNGERYKGEHNVKRIETKSEAELFLHELAGKKGIVADVSKKRAIKPVPYLYSLPVLQMEANAKFGMTLKQTLDTVQWLYENHYTTYPRTQSQFLTEDMEPTINDVLDKLSIVSEYAKLIIGRKRIFDRPHYFDNKKVESHFAIIPTGELPTKLTPMQNNIYDLICRSVIRMLYSAAVIEKTNVVTEVDTEKFLSSGSVIVDPQWMLVSGMDRDSLLPDLTKGEPVDGDYRLNERETEPPKHYTEKTLLSAMMTAGKSLADEELRKILSDPSVAGIGTAATRDAIIETLLAREYIERSGKSIKATEKGISLIQCFPVEEVKSPELTAKWEQRLAEIERGKESSQAFIQDIEASLKKWCQELTIAKNSTIGEDKITKDSNSKSTLQCPLCGREIKTYTWGWGCIGYKDGCTFSVSNKIAGKKITEKQANKLITSGKTSVIKGFKNKAGKSFDAKLVLEDSKVVFKFGA